MQSLKCKYCGKPVGVVENSQRRRIFVDKEIVRFIRIQTHGDAYGRYVTVGGERCYGRPPKPSETNVTEGYVEHKYSCEKQYPFRDKGKKARKKKHE